MKNTILSSAVYEVWIVIRFLQAEGNGAAHIHLRLYYVDMLFTVNSDNWWVMNWYVIGAECKQFKKQTHKCA